MDWWVLVLPSAPLVNALVMVVYTPVLLFEIAADLVIFLIFLVPCAGSLIWYG